MDPAEYHIPDDPEEIESIIETLPKGIVSVKTIRGKARYYHQWYENHRQQTKYIRFEDYPELKSRIEYRKELERRLEQIRPKRSEPIRYQLDVLTGDALRTMTYDVIGLDRRDCYPILERYLHSRSRKVCVLYGLRRTGKSTLMLHAIDGLSDEEFERAAYIHIEKRDSMASLRHDLFLLQEQGFRFVFIDEATLIDGFIDSSAFFADVIAAMGMRIVLSGTDSLGFLLAQNDLLYGKVVGIHTTYIPYREHRRLLGIEDVDDYIRYGGVLRQVEFDIESPPETIDDLAFYDESTASKYVDIAIARNIQNSLKKYDWGNNFRSLVMLNEYGLLTGAINRVVSDTNHRFLATVMNDDYHSQHVDEVVRNVGEDRNPATRDDVFDLIDMDRLNSELMKALDISNPDERARLSMANVEDIRDYLELLEVFTKMPVETQDPHRDVSSYSLCIQPGMRFCQAQEFVRILSREEAFRNKPPEKRRAILDRAEETIFGHMLEEIVLYDTLMSIDARRYSVFKLFLLRGDVDMVIVDNKELTCTLFEIKHSSSDVPTQYRRLFDPECCDYIERTWGRIVGRFVLYRGTKKDTGKGVRYLNVSEFLANLPKSAKDLFKTDAGPRTSTEKEE